MCGLIDEMQRIGAESAIGRELENPGSNDGGKAEQV
jgi:hypothetical protein